MISAHLEEFELNLAESLVCDASLDVAALGETDVSRASTTSPPSLLVPKLNPKHKHIHSRAPQQAREMQER